MMVASSSLINLQQSRQQGFITDPSVSDMAFHMRGHDGQPIDTRSLFNSQNNSFHKIPDAEYPPPSYKEAIQANSAGRMYVSPSSMGDMCYSEFNNNGSVSPNGHNFTFQDGPRRSHHLNHQKHGGSQLSPSRLSPPTKRLVSTMQNHYYDQTNPPNRSISPSPIDDDQERSRFPSNQGQHEEMQTNDLEFTVNPMITTTAPGVSVDDQKFYETPFSLQSTAAIKRLDEEDNNVSRSPTRHTSLSSTHSSGRSTASKATTPNRAPSVKPSKTPTKISAQGFFFDDDDDDSWKICSVCGDKATGYHFNALTCEGCKGFFRRSMKNGKAFTCPYNGNCTITKSNRRQCQACRLDKCLRIGMKKECIMSHNEIQMKKSLMLNNRIKRSIVEWKPLEYTQERRELIELIYSSHCQTNIPPDIKEDDGVVTVHRNPAASPASSTSSGFSDLINQMTQDIVATAPGEKNADEAHLRHFSAIMEFSIKQIIKFCKKIPTFITLSLKDQITLLKSGCTEILFIKANYTYDREQDALMCGPGKYYTRESFILGGMSEEYTDCYLQFHHDLSHMRLDDTELASICAATLFSSDRDELENKEAVEKQQEQIVIALQSYTENHYHCRMRFPKIMAYLTRLRTLNWHISKTLKRLQNTQEGESITPLVLEVMPTL